MVSGSDLSELKRLATNAYNEEKSFLLRVLAGITSMNKEISMLREQVKQKTLT